IWPAPMIPIFMICSDEPDADNRCLGDKFCGADAFPALWKCRLSLIVLQLSASGLELMAGARAESHAAPQSGKCKKWPRWSRLTCSSPGSGQPRQDLFT